MNFSCVFLLTVEVLYDELLLLGDKIQFSWVTVGKLIILLRPLFWLVFDWFAQVAFDAMQVCRSNILDIFPWPFTNILGRLETLPPDLFNVQPLEKLVNDVKVIACAGKK